MRIVKLSKEVFGFDTVEASRAFFKHVLPFNKYFFGIAGKGKHISSNGLREGETVIFSYDAKIVCIGLNEELIEEEGRVTHIKLRENSLKVFDYDICLRELESILSGKGYRKRIVGSQGWNIVEKEYEKVVIDFLVEKEWEDYM